MAGLAAAGVDDAPARVAALEAQRQPPLVVEVEDDAARLQVADRGRRLLDQHPHRGGPAEAAAGGDRVGGVAVGRVVGFERRRQPALGPEAGALGERGAGDEADAAALLRRPQRRPEPGGAAADDGDVELARLAAIAPQPLGGSTPAARAARRRRPRGPAPARRRRRSRPRSARRSASSTRFSAASACASISPSRSSAAAIARSFASRSRCSASSCASRSCSRSCSASARSRSRSASSASISAVGAPLGARWRPRPPRRSCALGLVDPLLDAARCPVAACSPRSCSSI